MEGVKGLRPMLDMVTDGAFSRALASRKSESAGPRAVVYGPGRGLWHQGAWWLTRGPGAMGGSAKQRSGQERPSLHCSSWTALLAGYAVGRDAAWDHRGTLVALPTLLEQGAWSKDVGTKTLARGMGYGGSFDRLDGGRNSASGRDLHSGAAFVQRLLDEAGEGGALFLAAQSTKGANGWRWWHHTLALIVDPDAPGCVLRVAADGSRGAGGLYSGTPMDVEVWTVDAPPDPARLQFWAWKLKPEHLRPSTAPIHLEP